MIPISDANPSRRLPVMNLTLIGLNILVFLFEIQLPQRAFSPRVLTLDGFINTWGLVPGRLLDAIANPFARQSLHAFETLITSQFIHAGWLHIVGNMLFLFIFGDNIEDVMGSGFYLIFYLVCGIAAGLAQTFVLAPLSGGLDIPSIGASGAIAGVLGAYIVLYPTTRVRVLVPIFIIPFVFTVSAWFMLGIWFLEQFFLGVITLTPAQASAGGVAVWAHVGGFIAGMILILPFFPKARQLKASRVTRFSVPYEDETGKW